MRDRAARSMLPTVRRRALDEQLVELAEMRLRVRERPSATPPGRSTRRISAIAERPIGHVVQHVHRQRDVEAVVGERQRLRVDSRATDRHRPSGRALRSMPGRQIGAAHQARGARGRAARPR